MSTLRRVTFDVARSSEYFTVKELQIQTGTSVGSFGDVVLKELFDNAIDEAEEAGKVPEIHVELRWRSDGSARLSVRDNGRGLDPDVVRRILNFDTRTSSKALYRSPTRGALGNALKCIIGMPLALGCSEPVVITACGVRHSITLRVDPLGRVHVDDDTAERGVTVGTTIEVTLPRGAWTQSQSWMVLYGAALFNPHALVQFRETGRSASSNAGRRCRTAQCVQAAGGAGERLA